MYESLRGKTNFLACFFGLPTYIVEIFSTRISSSVARYSAKGVLHLISGDEMIFSILEQIANSHYYLFENTNVLANLLKKYSEKQEEEIKINEEIIISDKEDFEREISNFVPSYKEDDDSDIENTKVYTENDISNFSEESEENSVFKESKKSISRSVLCPDGNVLVFVETIPFKRFILNQVFENVFPREFSPEDIDDSEVEDLYAWITGIAETRYETTT